MKILLFLLLPLGVQAIEFKNTYHEKMEDIKKLTDLKSEDFRSVQTNPGSYGPIKIYNWTHPSETVPDPDLGYRHHPSSQVKHIVRSDTQIIYDAIYSFDQYSRRYAPVEDLPSRKKFVIFYGCSYTYGNGLNDNQTLHYFLGKLNKNYYPYNYAIGATGPNSMLALVQQNKFHEQIPQANGTFIYVYADFHTDRALGHYPSVTWLRDTPYYEMDKNGGLSRHGSFLTGRPIFTKLLMNLQIVFQFMGYGNNIIPAIKDKDHLYICALINETKKEFLRQYPQSNFVLYMHPTSRIPPILETCLQKNEIAYFKGKPLPENGMSIPIDGHPNEQANRLIAEELSAYLDQH